MTQQPERDALEAAARAIYEQSFQNAIATLGNPDTFGGWTLDSGNLRAFIAAYHAWLSAQGMRVMPREATDEMAMAGYVCHLPVFEDECSEPNPSDWGKAWSAMWDAADGGAK